MRLRSWPRPSRKHVAPSRNRGGLATSDACPPQLIAPCSFPPCPRGGITLPRSPSRWNIHGASLPAPILRVRAYPPPIDAGLLTSGLPLLVAVGLVRQDPACCAVYLDCNVRSTPSGSTADVPQTAESSNRGTLFEWSRLRARRLHSLSDSPPVSATL